MKILHIRVIAFFLFTGLIAGCGTKTEVITNSYSSAEPGNIKGKVTLYDTNGVVLSDASGVKVVMEGTTFSTLTASDGTWGLVNVPAGTYPSVMYSKEGFPTFKSHQNGNGSIGAYIVGGGGTQYDGFRDLYQICNISVELVLRGFEDYSQLTAHDTLINLQRQTVYDTVIIPFGKTTLSSHVIDIPKNSVYNYYGGLFFGVSPDIYPANPKTYLYATLKVSGVQQTDYVTGVRDFVIIASELKKAGFKSGQTVYCVSYFGNRFLSYNSYFDYELGMTIYPGLSPHHSEVKNFILP